MIHLETERLIFRQWKAEDFNQLAKFFSKKENALFVGGVKNSEDSWRLLATYIGHYELLSYSYLALQERSSGNLIGTVGLWNSEPWPEPELGYWLLPEAQGKGFGYEAGIRVRDFALNELKMDSLVSYIDTSNESSKKLARNLGASYDKTINLLGFGPHEVYRYR
ncbi:GNAT family N-acetyltransferase [Ekhidna sp.]|uniref:GNAT family N-acetyltransferase n=1 Tax=Ekhidna sp. TaxID=2608089 RepID=UPI003296A790